MFTRKEVESIIKSYKVSRAYKGHMFNRYSGSLKNVRILLKNLHKTEFSYSEVLECFFDGDRSKGLYWDSKKNKRYFKSSLVAAGILSGTAIVTYGVTGFLALGVLSSNSFLKSSSGQALKKAIQIIQCKERGNNKPRSDLDYLAELCSLHAAKSLFLYVNPFEDEYINRILANDLTYDEASFALKCIEDHRREQQRMAWGEVDQDTLDQQNSRPQVAGVSAVRLFSQ